MKHTRIMFSAGQAAAALWSYGEDELSTHAELFTDRQLRELWSLAGSHWRTDHGLPIDGKPVLDKITAITCVEYLEGGVRPLARERRRPRRTMPRHLRDAGPVAPAITFI